jgi:hypothetical protein
MTDEALIANEENKMLQAELRQRGDTSSALIKQQQQSYDDLRKAQIECEVITTTAAFHESSILNIKDIVNAQER